MSLLVVGSFALDSVETPSGRREEVLGGSASYMSAAASFFSPVSVSGVVGQDFPEAHLDFLRGRGVDVGGVQRGHGRTFRWRGLYGRDLNQAETLVTELNIFATWRPQLTEAQARMRWVMLGNFGPEAQGTVVDQLAAEADGGRRATVGCDTMNYWIAGHTRALKETLARVDMLSVNEAEARQLTGEQNLLRAARAVRALGPRLLVVKRGEYGAMVFDDDGIFAIPAYPLEEVVDPTGAGDTFAGGMLGYLAREAGDGPPGPALLRRAVVAGSALASFVIEDFSVDRLRALTDAELGGRIERYAAMIGPGAPDGVAPPR